MKEYKLPNGKITTSAEKYSKTWTDLADLIAKNLNCNVIGVDPGIHLIEKDSSTGFFISTDMAFKIKHLIDNQK